MCEFNVVVNGRIVFGDVVHAKADGSKVIVKDILGDSMEFENCKITEVDVNRVHLILSPIKGLALEP